METCLVCKQPLNGNSVCPNCGFDDSTNYRDYPTLSQSPLGHPSCTSTAEYPGAEKKTIELGEERNTLPNPTADLEISSQESKQNASAPPKEKRSGLLSRTLLLVLLFYINSIPTFPTLKSFVYAALIFCIGLIFAFFPRCIKRNTGLRRFFAIVLMLAYFVLFLKVIGKI